MGGGDLLNLLIERDVFEEDFTRFYVAEVRLNPAQQCHHGCSLPVLNHRYLMSANDFSPCSDDSGYRVMSQTWIHSQGY